MLKASHVNLGATVALSSVILSGGHLSIFLMFYPLLALLDDADHHAGTVSKALKFRLPWATHRGYSHSLLFNILVGLAIFYGFKHFYPDLGMIDLYVLLGISLSHLLGDFFTRRGIPLLYPLTSYNFGLPLFTTGTSVEKLITLAVSIGNIGAFGYIILNYIMTKTYDLPVYDTKMIMVAGASQAFIVYLLLQDEIKYFKKNLNTVFTNIVRLVGFIIINAVALYGVYYIAIVKNNILDIDKIAGAVGVSQSIALIGLAVIGMIPSMFQSIKRIDDMSFELASAVNVVLIVSIIGFFGFQLV